MKKKDCNHREGVKQVMANVHHGATLGVYLVRANSVVFYRVVGSNYYDNLGGHLGTGLEFDRDHIPGPAMILIRLLPRTSSPLGRNYICECSFHRLYGDVVQCASYDFVF